MVKKYRNKDRWEWISRITRQERIKGSGHKGVVNNFFNPKWQPTYSLFLDLKTHISHRSYKFRGIRQASGCKLIAFSGTARQSVTTNSCRGITRIVWFQPWVNHGSNQWICIKRTSSTLHQCQPTKLNSHSLVLVRLLVITPRFKEQQGTRNNPS